MRVLLDNLARSPGSDMPSAIGLVFNKIIELPRLCAFKPKFAQACEAFKI